MGSKPFNRFHVVNSLKQNRFFRRWHRQDSNPRQLDYRSAALSTSPSRTYYGTVHKSMNLSA